MNRTALKCIATTGFLLVAIPSFAITATKTLYGLQRAEHFKGHSSGHVYIQLGDFSNRANAEHLAESFRIRTLYPVVVSPKDDNFIVTLGPISSAAEVRSVGRALVAYQPIVQEKPVERVRPTIVENEHTDAVPVLAPEKDSIIKSGNWYIAGEAGIQVPNVDNPFIANNNSGFPAPYNVDMFTTGTESSAVIGVEGGYRWYRQTQWLPVYALGLRYKHFFTTDIGQQVMQNSLPEFTNYNYNWNASSDALLLSTKINIFQYHQLLPYINGGIGVAFNQTSGYSETALSGVTPRISPAFASKTSNEFTYSLGLGIDWQMTQQFIMSLGYEFQDLGNISSGNGVGTWSGSAIQAGTYQSNSALLRMSYVI